MLIENVKSASSEANSTIVVNSAWASKENLFLLAFQTRRPGTTPGAILRVYSNAFRSCVTYESAEKIKYKKMFAKMCFVIVRGDVDG
mmetsp:Transcript_9200/g.13806  ORF Transcript_9200/g.13806 Transcript_9200/m.13806 type:complete len:87 (-) Transcript_9200:552-812(-)